MFKIAAILTSAAIACSGGAACSQSDCTAQRLAAIRCGRSTCATASCQTNQKPACGQTTLAGSCGSITLNPDCTDGALNQGNCDAAQTPNTPDAPETEAPEAPEEAPETNADSALSEYAAEVIRLVNVERANAGLSPLTTDALLNQAAQRRATEIDASFSHTRPDGSSCFTVLKEMGISYVACGENIAKGSPTPARVVDGWMNSAGHRKNILNENFTAIGVGYYVDAAGTAHWAQMFIAR